MSVLIEEDIKKIFKRQGIEVIDKGCPNAVLEGWCPAEFSSNLP